MITRGEIRYGLARLKPGKKQRELEQRAEHLFAAIPAEPISEQASDVYGRLKREAQQRGTPLDENDLWIAASAVATGSTLVTSDKDFRAIPELLIEEWG